MSETQHCPDCGAAYELGAAGGHCASCLLRIGLVVAGGDGLDVGESLSNDSLPGTIRYLGDYELTKEIGRGGMGVVYQARQASLHRLVALKLIRAGELANEAEVARFRAEAEAAAHLDYPNIVPIYEVGEHEGRHYFSMKLVEGGTLAEKVISKSVFSESVAGHRTRRTDAAPITDSLMTDYSSPRSCAALLAQIARAVHYAHQRGVLHRDLKPGNILLDAQGQPHITDFGLARRIDTDSAMTQSGTIVGTPSYMAPEQAQGVKQLTTAADVYSLGAILYELLAGRPPFIGATVLETLQKVMSEEPVPPSRRRKEVISDSVISNQSAPDDTPACKKTDSLNTDLLITDYLPPLDCDLDTICLKCLAKDPARRYASAEALADDLERWQCGEPIHARPVTTAERFTKWTRRNPLLAGSLAALVVVGLLGLAGILWQWREAVAARNTAQQQLWQSLGQQAHFSLRSGKIGQRTNALVAISLAAAIRPSLALRNDALAALLLPDLGARLSWKPGESGIYPWCFDSTHEHYVLHDDEGFVTVYRAGDHSPVRKLGRGRGGTAYAQFSPDDRLLAVAFESGGRPSELQVWDWHSGKLVAQTTNAHAKFSIPSFDFTPDGRELLYADRRAGLGRLNLASGQPLPPLLTNVVTAIVRVSPDGAHVATGKSLRVEVWKIASSRSVARADFSAFPGTQFIQTLVWAPNGGGLIVSGHETGLYLLRLNGSPPEHFGDAKNIVATSLFFNTTGDLLFVGGWNDVFQIWDMATLTPLIHESHAHGSPRSLSRNGRRLALTREKVGLGIWEFFEPTGLRKFIQPLEVDSWAASLDVHPTGRWLVTTHRDAWLLWDTARARVVARGTAGQATTAKFMPDGTAFHTCGPEGLQSWPLHEIQTSNLTFQISVGPAELLTPGLPALPLLDKKRSVAKQILPLLNSLEWRYAGSAFSADGRYLALLGNGYIFRINLTNHGFARPIQMRRPGDSSYGISDDGRWFWTGYHNKPGLDFYDLEEGEFVKTLVEPGQGGGIFQPRTGEFVASNTRGLTFWQTGGWKVNREVPLPEVGLGYGLVAMAPDARTAWYAWASKMRLLDVATGQFFATLEHPASLYAGVVAFDATAPRAYAVNGNGIIAWDLAALRRELAHLGLDWSDENPGEGFAPRH